MSYLAESRAAAGDQPVLWLPERMSNLHEDAVVLALARQQETHLAPFRHALSLPLVIDETWEPGVFDRYNVALLLVLSNDVWPSDVCLREARKRRIPSLFLMDGILEFRHQWTNPRFAAGGGAPFMMPVLADKIACKGLMDARRLESWGNHGKCEIVGLPRLDTLLPTKPWRERPRHNPPRILIASANRPWFTPGQQSQVVRAFASLQAFTGRRSDIDFEWRLRGELKRRLLLPSFAEPDGARPVAEVLQEVDAVITQPSTLQLEAMMSGLPVALFDFENVPHFVPAAWRITAESQIDSVVDSLLHADPARLCYQNECLHNTLSCQSPATPRMVRLIEELIVVGNDARANNGPLRIPARVLPSTQPMPLSADLDLRRQYEGHPAFGNTDLLDMQRRLAMLERELESARHTLRRRSLGFWVERGCERAAQEMKSFFSRRGLAAQIQYLQHP
jgi:hypothetical protein